jgi:urease accessory protein
MRDLLPPPDADLRAGVTRLPGMLIIRWLSTDAARLRASFTEAWTVLRHAAAGLPATAPANWNC